MHADRRARSERLTVLLARCGQRHEAAFEELYRLSSAQLYGVLVRILKIEAVAEEALQESFIKIWDKSGTYAPEVGAPMAWMSSIARNQALDLLRRSGSREHHESTGLVSLIEETPDAAKPLHEMSEDAQLLQQCLDRLPEASRDCLVRAYCEGYSHDELAEASGTPLGTVKSWIRRGLISLRKCLDELA